MITWLESDLAIKIGDWDAFWSEAEQVESGILVKRYASNGEIALTYEELAKMLGRNQEWVRTHVTKAVHLMQHPLRCSLFGGRHLSVTERLGG